MEIYIAITVTLVLLFAIIIKITVNNLFDYIDDRLDQVEHNLMLKLNKIENKLDEVNINKKTE